MINEDSSVIINVLYPLIEDRLNKRTNQFINNIGKFMTERHKELYDVAPYDRILFNQKDVDAIFSSLGISELEVNNIIKDCFFYNIDYTPKCAKEPYVETLMCAIRYFLKNNDRKKAELTAIYTCFTGKFYASLHSNYWRKFPPRQNQSAMEYVVNNMLTDKFDLKKEGTIFGVIKKLSCTWLDTYKEKITNSKTTDDGFGKLIQQLRDRESSFLKNIANLYFEAVNSKIYLNYETDSLDPDSFRITNNDASRAGQITESVVSLMTSQKIDLKLINAILKEETRVRENSIRGILEYITGDSNNINDLKFVVNVIICDFMSSKTYDRVGSPNFIRYSIAAKPNTKNEYLIKMKNIIIGWLSEDETYRKRCNTPATATSYYKAIIKYIVFMICRVTSTE